MKTKRKIKLNLWQQIAIGGIAILLLITVATWLGPPLFDVARDSRWLAMVILAYFATGGLITSGIVYGLWLLGDHDV